MPIRLVRLGTARHEDEGPRLGTVRRPPRGVPKTEFKSGNWYDVWFPVLAPSPETMKLGLSATTDKEWAQFIRKFRAEMAAPEAQHCLNLLAEMSHSTNFSLGCYCENEARCHRGQLREMLLAKGAKVI